MRERQRPGRKRDRDPERRGQRPNDRECQRPERGVRRNPGDRDSEKRMPGAQEEVPSPRLLFPLGRCVGGEPSCLELGTWSPMSLPLISPRLVLHALADLVQGPGHLRNPHHGSCPLGLCGGPEGVPLPPGPGEFPSTLPPLGWSTSCP